jgi:hypothetical protein
VLSNIEISQLSEPKMRQRHGESKAISEYVWHGRNIKASGDSIQVFSFVKMENKALDIMVVLRRCGVC